MFSTDKELLKVSKKPPKTTSKKQTIKSIKTSENVISNAIFAPNSHISYPTDKSHESESSDIVIQAKIERDKRQFEREIRSKCVTIQSCWRRRNTLNRLCIHFSNDLEKKLNDLHKLNQVFILTKQRIFPVNSITLNLIRLALFNPYKRPLTTQVYTYIILINHYNIS